MDCVGVVVEPVGESAIDEVCGDEVRFWVCHES